MKSKLNIVIAASMILFFSVNDFTNAQENHKEFKEWAELKSFHEVIAQTFHPMEEGNFKPIRERSAELNQAAIKLAASKIPADLNRPEVVNAVKELASETKQLDELVQKKGSDN